MPEDNGTQPSGLITPTQSADAATAPPAPKKIVVSDADAPATAPLPEPASPPSTPEASVAPQPIFEPAPPASAAEQASVPEVPAAPADPVMPEAPVAPAPTPAEPAPPAAPPSPPAPAEGITSTVPAAEPAADIPRFGEMQTKIESHPLFSGAKETPPKASRHLLKKTFLPLTILLVVLVILYLAIDAGLIRGGSHLPFHIFKQPVASTTPTITTQSTQAAAATTTTDPYAGWQTYTSTLGGFSIKYPSTWLITGFINNNPPVNNLTGNETQIRLQTASDSTKTDNFGGDFHISTTAPQDTPYPTYPQGAVVQTLANGVEVWQDNKSQTWSGGKVQANDCPSIQIASNSAFGIKLKNGKYLSARLSYCWAQGMTTAMTYDQQTQSTAYKDAIMVFASISQQ